MQPAPPASSQASNHQLKPFLALMNVFRHYAGLGLSR
uniref:Uncharacterized protein n=1 Tax=Raoultella planticola TaxID=575 RepID=W8CT67_RAOPL|nr:hypothetical protein pKpNDM1_00031 [Raoultella planticola]